MTITTDRIRAAIRAQLAGAFAGEAVYEQLVHEGFQRPSNLIELAKITMDPMGLGGGLVGLRYDVVITTFCEVDPVHDSHLPTLDLRAMTILGLFSAGYLKVGDRALKAAALTADTSLYDAAEVKLTLTLAVDRRELQPEAVGAELMRTLHMRLNDTEEEIT